MDEQIVNGDFELGDFTGWELDGVWDGVYIASKGDGEGAHSGEYGAGIKYDSCMNEGGWIKQTFGTPISVESILTFSLWATGWCSGYPSIIRVYVGYDDESESSIDFEAGWYYNDGWVKFDAMTVLIPYKKVVYIKIEAFTCTMGIDDVSLGVASFTISVDTQTVTDLVPPSYATFHGAVSGTGGVNVTQVGFDYKYAGDNDWTSIVDDVTEVIPYSFSKQITNRIYYKLFSYRAKVYAEGEWHYGWVLYYESCFMNIANATRSHCFERILNLKISQTVDVATRPIPTREDGEVVDTGTYIIHPLQVTFDSRLTDAEKTVIQAMLDDHLTITFYLGSWTFSNGWFVGKGIVWEYVSDDELNIRPWKCSFKLIFESVAYVP